MILCGNKGATASIPALRLPKLLSHEWGGGLFPFGQNSRGVKLTNLFHLLPKLITLSAAAKYLRFLPVFKV